MNVLKYVVIKSNLLYCTWNERKRKSIVIIPYIKNCFKAIDSIQHINCLGNRLNFYVEYKRPKTQ